MGTDRRQHGAGFGGPSPVVLTARGPLVRMVVFGTGAVVALTGTAAGHPIAGWLAAAVSVVGAACSQRLMRLSVDGRFVSYGFLGRNSVPACECERIGYREGPGPGRVRVIQLVLRDGRSIAFPSLSFRPTLGANLAGVDIYSRATSQWIERVLSLSRTVGLEDDTFMRPC